MSAQAICFVLVTVAVTLLAAVGMANGMTMASVLIGGVAIVLLYVAALIIVWMARMWATGATNNLRGFEARGYRRALADFDRIVRGGRIVYTVGDLEGRLHARYTDRYGQNANERQEVTP